MQVIRKSLLVNYLTNGLLVVVCILSWSIVRDGNVGSHLSSCSSKNTFSGGIKPVTVHSKA